MHVCVYFCVHVCVCLLVCLLACLIVCCLFVVYVFLFLFFAFLVLFVCLFVCFSTRVKRAVAFLSNGECRNKINRLTRLIGSEIIYVRVDLVLVKTSYIIIFLVSLSWVSCVLHDRAQAK